MDRPLIPLSNKITLDKGEIRFLTPVIEVSPHHTEGYWLLFRKQIWELKEDFVFVVKGYKVTARKGTLTDFASTPKALWFIYPPTDSKYNKSVLGHDILYLCEIFPRWFNDLFLKVGMAKEGSSRLTIFNFHTAVSTWGWTVYSRHTEKSVSKARDLVIVERLDL